jgi:hypothetical protein
LADVVSNYPRGADRSEEAQREIGYTMADMFIAFRGCHWVPTIVGVLSLLTLRTQNILLPNTFFPMAAAILLLYLVYVFAVGIFAILHLGAIRRWPFPRTMKWISGLVLCLIPIIGMIPSFLISRFLFNLLQPYGIHSNPRQLRQELVDAISRWRLPELGP